MTDIWDVTYGDEPRGQIVTYNGIPCTARTCVTRLNRLTGENENLMQYKRRVSDVLISWSQKDLTAMQLQIVIAIMEELNVPCDD